MWRATDADAICRGSVISSLRRRRASSWHDRPWRRASMKSRFRTPTSRGHWRTIHCVWTSRAWLRPLVATSAISCAGSAVEVVRQTLVYHRGLRDVRRSAPRAAHCGQALSPRTQQATLCGKAYRRSVGGGVQHVRIQIHPIRPHDRARVCVHGDAREEARIL